jgi:NADPH:quinone reductase
MNYQIQINSYGGPEVLQAVACEMPSPAVNEVAIQHTAIGLNFIDVYERTGLYQSKLPLVLGKEAAGVVTAIGERVRGFKVGDRVAYSLSHAGAYTQFRNVDADKLIKLPNNISDEMGAAILLKGLTAQMLLRQTYRVKQGDWILIHAAAGGVGLILTQWALHLGANVIAIVGSSEKAKLVQAHGATHILLDSDDWVTATRQLTHNQGVAAVYDSVGQATFMRSLDCLKPRGMMVTFGNSSGPVQPIAPAELNKRGSLFLTRPSVFHYLTTRDQLQRAARELFAVIKSGAVRTHIGQRYSLKDVARAHQDLEARMTVGSTVLVP